jgi:hypothetical protein
MSKTEFEKSFIFVPRDRSSVESDPTYDVEAFSFEHESAFFGGPGPSSTLARTPVQRRGQLEHRDQSTLTDLSSSSDLPEIEIVSLISEELPKYRLRAGTVVAHLY